MSAFPYFEVSLSELFTCRLPDGSPKVTTLEANTEPTVVLRADDEKATIKAGYFLAAYEHVPPDEADISVIIQGLRIGADSTCMLDAVSRSDRWARAGLNRRTYYPTFISK